MLGQRGLTCWGGALRQALEKWLDLPSVLAHAWVMGRICVNGLQGMALAPLIILRQVCLELSGFRRLGVDRSSELHRQLVRCIVTHVCHGGRARLRL